MALYFPEVHVHFWHGAERHIFGHDPDEYGWLIAQQLDDKTFVFWRQLPAHGTAIAPAPCSRRLGRQTSSN
jgi:hypothetical protein